MISIRIYWLEFDLFILKMVLIFRKYKLDPYILLILSLHNISTYEIAII